MESQESMGDEAWCEDESVSSKHSATTTATAVARSVGFGEARPPGVAKYSATTAAIAVAPTVAKSVGKEEARLSGFAKYSVTSILESDLAESSDEASSSDEDGAGSSWSGASSKTSTAVAKYCW